MTETGNPGLGEPAERVRANSRFMIVPKLKPDVAGEAEGDIERSAR